jgi:hypothetical protein
VTEPEELEFAIELYRCRAAEINALIQQQAPVPSEVVRDVALAAALTLRAYCLPNNWNGPTAETARRPLPPELASAIARHIQVLCGGHIPHWILHLQRRGAPSVDPTVRTWQGFAVAYIKMSKQGLIADRSPTARIGSLYGVTRRTVQNWCRDLDCEITDFFPYAANDRERADLIIVAMKSSAEKYRLWGGGPSNPKPFGKGRQRPRAKR